MKGRYIRCDEKVRVECEVNSEMGDGGAEVYVYRENERGRFVECFV